MKSVTVLDSTCDGRMQHSINYTLNSPDKDLISRIDSIIFRGQCDYYGLNVDIPKGFCFNITYATDCEVTMWNIPNHIVNHIAHEVAKELGVMLDATKYEYR